MHTVAVDDDDDDINSASQSCLREREEILNSGLY